MDAISFVLGIKSSHLRSAHLRDLVFRDRVLRTSKINTDGSATTNGVHSQINRNEVVEEVSHPADTTQERHDPKSAWVMAVFLDDAGDEQFWKRAITTQGGSEYKINDRLVTAQQYNETLEAENILIKARNFLVFQGDVEAIASQSPRDLTKLIEQISGSLEYKAEYEKLKDQADQALENQNFALHRRRGINSEIKQYTEQKNEADSYARKADERDQAIITHILWRLYHYRRSIIESSAAVQQHKDELQEQRRGIEKYDKALEDAKREQAKVNREVSKIEKGIKQKEKEVESKENGLVPIAEKIQITTKNSESRRKRMLELSQQRDLKSGDVKQLAKNLKVVEKAQSVWDAEFAKRAAQGGKELGQADIHQYNSLKEEVNKQASTEQGKVDSLTRQKKADEETVNSLRTKVDNFSSRIERLKEELRDIDEHITHTNGEVKQTSKEIGEKKKACGECRSERIHTDQLRTEKYEKLQEVSRKLGEAEDGRQQSEKDVKLKAILADLKRNFSGVKGRVTELCKPTEKRYATAVSTVLGRDMDSVIVENAKTAIECIAYLGEHRRGHLTFLPLDTVQFTAHTSNIKGQQRGCRMALDTINYDRSLERAFSHICGNAVVCDNYGIAREFVHEKRNDVKAVTLEGTVIHRGGNMTGGQNDKNESRRFDDNETDSLRHLQEKLQRELESLPDTRRNRSEEETLEGEVTGLEQKLSYTKDELIGRERNRSDKQKELAHMKKELATAKPQFDGKQKEFDDLETHLKSGQDTVNQIQDRIFSDFCHRLQFRDIREYEGLQGTLQQEGAQKKLEYSQQRDRLESQLKFRQQQLQDLHTRIKEFDDHIQQDKMLMADLKTKEEASQNELDTLMVELDQSNEQLEQGKAKYDQKAERVAEQRREVQKRGKAVDSILKTIEGLEADRQLKASGRYSLLRRCKLENIQIPLEENSTGFDRLPLDDILQIDGDAMDIDDDQGGTTLQSSEVQDYGIIINFDDLDEDLREVCRKSPKCSDGTDRRTARR